MFTKSKGKRRTKRMAPPTIISSDLRVDGDISSDGEIQIDGTVAGDVKGSKLSIGEGGTIKGAVTADRVLVRGRITGQITGRIVTLTRTAQVTGDVLHETLAIEPGARLEGTCRRMEAGKDSNINLVVSDGTPGR